MAYGQSGHSVSMVEYLPVMAFSITGKVGDVGLVKDKRNISKLGCNLGHNVAKLRSTQTITLVHEMTASYRMGLLKLLCDKCFLFMSVFCSKEAEV